LPLSGFSKRECEHCFDRYLSSWTKGLLFSIRYIIVDTIEALLDVRHFDQKQRAVDDIGFVMWKSKEE
jgi:hypothetical protein